MKIIAFIPVRGGSKSIPLKNIKPFCGKPLVCWNIEALENCPLVDEIIVATDSVEIENTVLAQTYQKTAIYHPALPYHNPKHPADGQGLFRIPDSTTAVCRC